MNSNFTQFLDSLQAALRYGNKALSEESVSGAPWFQETIFKGYSIQI